MLETNNPTMSRSGDALIDATLGRLPRWMVGVSAAAIVGCLVAGQIRFAAGLGLGAGTALLGYWWLYRGIEAALGSQRPQEPGKVLLKLALRYPLLVGAVLLADRTGWLPARAVVIGLFAPLAGVLIECLVLAVQVVRGPWRQVRAGHLLR